MAGRPRLPAEQKKQQGTYQKSRNPKNEPKFTELQKMPPCPKKYGMHGKRLWEYAGELVAAGVITAPDIISFEMLCEIYERYKIAAEYVAKDPEKNIQAENWGRSAQVIQMNIDLNACIKLMSEFGLTPASRNKFGVTKKAEKDKDAAKMENILYGNFGGVSNG